MPNPVPRHRRRGWLTALLTVLAMLVFVLERLIVDDLRALGRWLARRRWVARAEARVAQLSPYPALLCFVVPGLAILPVKLLAVAMLSHGHVLMGVGVLLAAKALGTLAVTRIYHAAEPALLRLGWFARLRTHWLQLRAALYDSVRTQAWWQAASVRVQGWRDTLHAWRRQGGQRGRRRWAAIRRRLRQLNAVHKTRRSDPG